MHLIADAHDLTEAEQELIRAAVGNQGVLEVAVRAETHGRAVVAGRKKFFDPKDRSVAERYISLLDRDSKSWNSFTKRPTRKHMNLRTSAGN